ncbi:MAG: DMT family transporter [Zymomonas mobilis subsp. pomaceae]|uniref:EamA domain-containing protein n=1 Tax=Zymomonas mobilis subsp. pomaceae (strain ATCC 29192 / DSM 22645 / JCM 10191 / CCUG 17912 / NBRC 13757 / NCIMB 11200 / NRRL B-4491 / Barker I) TaxID=579138 RepID=F8EW54_ZYMMT|nr:DMT family transporter [Zymomonas mobilis]AEI38464.1 protein of unknown function DUF6 transmembrane [Zymomonas mobilis subsp. pomaceae ATCC 29192]MDX5948153.1 DMT family transporter [Zymomonas mobilis subsp. pomaceae]GEB89736.1 transporter [Zymomonas mobilis subsp. pomaceae]
MEKKGIILALWSYLLFTISDAGSKLLEGQVDPFEAAFMAGLMGTVAIPFVRKPHESYINVFGFSHFFIWLVRAVSVALCTFLCVVAFTKLSMPEAMALLFLLPLFVNIIALVFLNEKVSLSKWIALIIGFIGTLVVLRPESRPFGIGHLAAIGGAFCTGTSWAVFRATDKKKGGLVTKPSRLSLYGAGVIGPIIIDGILMLPHWTIPTPIQWVYLSIYGFLAAAGQLLMMIAAEYAEANTIALPQYSQMIWTVIFSYVIFHQPIDNIAFLGIGIILLSGYLTWRSGRSLVKAPLPPIAHQIQKTLEASE